MRPALIAKRIICGIYLLLFAFSELYSAAATSLDNTHRFPTWEPTLGRWMFILPCILVAGMTLLLLNRLRAWGFTMIFASLLIYGAFFIFEVHLSQHAPKNHTVGTIGVFWSLAFAIAFVAAYLWGNREIPISN
jgi:hypothetical protein